MPILYTKNGDLGTTCLYNGQKVSKSDETISLLGKIDSFISLFGRYVVNNDQKYSCILDGLMDICTIVANPGKNYIFDEKLELLRFIENETDSIMEKLPKLTKFIHSTNDYHIVRTSCRETESLIVHTVVNRNLSKNILSFFNRLSSLLFALGYQESMKKKVIYYSSKYLTNIQEEIKEEIRGKIKGEIKTMKNFLNIILKITSILFLLFLYLYYVFY